MEDIRYSIIIPVYNGENTLSELAARLGAVFQEMGAAFEVIFVDDHSRDRSWSILEGLALRDSRIRCIRLSRNFGQHNATLCGMAHARGSCIVTMDDDLQHAPEDIPLLIKKMQETGCRAVIARLVNKKFPYYRRKASDLMRKAAERIIKKPAGIHLSSFRLLDGPTAQGMLRCNTPFPYIPALLFEVTANVANVEIEHRARIFGESNYTLAKMFKLACRLLIARLPFFRWLGSRKSLYHIEKAANLVPESGG